MHKSHTRRLNARLANGQQRQWQQPHQQPCTLLTQNSDSRVSANGIRVDAGTDLALVLAVVLDPRVLDPQVVHPFLWVARHGVAWVAGD